MGTDQVYASDEEKAWVERFVSFGGGDVKTAIAAFRRRVVPPATSVSAVTGDKAKSAPATAGSTPDSPPAPTPQAQAEIIPLIQQPQLNQQQQALDLGYLEDQALAESPAPDLSQEIELGFVTSAMVFAALPHKAVKDHIFKRKSGDTTLTVMNDPDIGIPYGRYPRLLLAHICTLAKRTGESRIFLGENQAEFVRQLGLKHDGAGKRSQTALLKQSAIQLFTASIRLNNATENKFNFQNLEVASQGSLIWTPHTNDGGMEKYIWKGFIDLSDSFFKQCVDHSFPIDLKTIQSFRSSVAIDIYVWLTYRMNTLNKPLKITWRQLKFQFGSEYSDDAIGVKNFKAKFLAQMKLVLEQYKYANVAATTEYLELSPSNTHIPRSVSR